MTRPFQWLVDRLPAHRPLRVLDLGCAECPEGEALIASGVALTGVDLDERSLERARERLPAGEFLCADASTEALDGGGRFDVLLMRRPDIAADPARWERAFARAREWLSPGGLVLVTTPGPQEAALARQWLEESGLGAKEPVAVEDEGFLVSGRSTGLRAARVVTWSDDADEQAEVCDPKTGWCGPNSKHSGG